MSNSFGRIVVVLCGLCLFATPTVTFLGQPYRLASFNQKTNAMWEFTSANETVDNWSTLLTVVDRPDARTRPDLDRLAQGVMDTYKSRGGRILMAKTMVDASGTPYNYMVAAFDQPAQRRFELNFVKAAMGAKNAYMAIYGVRVADQKDYAGKAKAYLNERSGEIGKELEKAVLPAVGTLPRKEF
ncbi:MAG: hypothetical protein HYX27_09975 [Acidobacteria bacterium]|nr:hypothetical protein [Acidobacteriota bacterium]